MQFMDKQPGATHLGGTRAWIIWLLAAIAFGYAFFHRVAPSVMVADLMSDFAIGGGMLGVLSALYFYPYFLLQIPLGALLDRLGARMLLFYALSLASAGSILFGVAESLWVAYLGRLLIGVGSAVGFLGSMSLASKWFAPQRFATMAGLAMFLAMMCGVFGQGPLAIFIESYGWRASQWGLGIFGAILAVLVFAIVRNEPDAQEGEERQVQPWPEVWDGLFRALRHLNTWKIAIVAASMSGPMLALGGLWGVPYVMQAYGLERAEAAFYVSLMLVGWAVCAPVSGALSERFKKRHHIMVAGSALLTFCLFVLCFLPTGPLVLTIGLLIVAGAAGGSVIACFALIRDTIEPKMIGSVTGIVNAATVASGAILQPVVGVILDFTWDGTTEDGARIYQLGDYQFAFICILMVSLIGFLVSLTLESED